MKSVCFIGDSHLAVLANAYRELPEDERVFDATFFAADNGAWGGKSFDWMAHGATVTYEIPIAPNGNRLVPQGEGMKAGFLRSAGVTDIDVSKYDHFVCVDCFMSITTLFDLMRFYRCDNLRPYSDRRLISEDCFVASGTGLLMLSRAYRIARMLQSITDRPIEIMTEPFASRETPSAATGKAGLYVSVEAEGNGSKLSELFRRCLDNIASDLSSKVTSQPVETTVDHIFTKREFAISSIFDLSKPEELERADFLHGNTAWGKTMLRGLSQRLTPSDGEGPEPALSADGQSQPDASPAAAQSVSGEGIRGFAARTRSKLKSLTGSPRVT